MVTSNLMLADKTALSPSEGLHQKFVLKKNSNEHKIVQVSENLTKEDVHTPILIKVPKDYYVDLIHQQKDSQAVKEQSYSDEIEWFSTNYESNTKIKSPLTKKCAQCEFVCTEAQENSGLRSGFQECLSDVLNWSDSDFMDPNIFELWNFRAKDKLIEENKIKFINLAESDIGLVTNNSDKMSTSERQWFQISKVQDKDDTPTINKPGLKEEMDSWTFPLNFIDFETTMVALPFNRDRHPYEAIAFQFSHYLVHDNGKIEHFNEYINTEKGKFPNYEFIRELKKSLEQNSGTVFQYSKHENTFLNHIYSQLLEDTSPMDRESLMAFIKTITKSKKDSVEKWEGERIMVDMLDLVKWYHYDPLTHGSNSIKAVLPAILNRSKILQEKYSKPIYGNHKGIKSLNFKDWSWIEIKDGKALDPYKKLPKLFDDISEHDFEFISEETEIKNGGEALTAYARMQLTEMTDYETKQLTEALLKYCELDTFAMVLIYEYWKEVV